MITPENETILVGVDGSQSSIDALIWSQALGSHLGLAVTAVMAWDHPTRSTAPDREGQNLTPEEMDEEVVTALRKAADEAGCDDVTCHALRGPTRTALQSASAAPGVNMLVLGTRGLGPIRGLMLGSVSRNLLFSTKCPLVLIPKDGAKPQFDRIVVGLDVSPISATVAAWSARWCRDLGASATVLRCVDPGSEHSSERFDEIMNRCRDDLDIDYCDVFHELRVPHEAIALAGDPRQQLIEVAQDQNAGVIVIGQRGMGQFDGLGGTASFLVRHSPLPLAIIPEMDDGHEAP